MTRHALVDLAVFLVDNGPKLAKEGEDWSVLTRCQPILTHIISTQSESTWTSHLLPSVRSLLRMFKGCLLYVEIAGPLWSCGCNPRTAFPGAIF